MSFTDNFSIAQWAELARIRGRFEQASANLMAVEKLMDENMLQPLIAALKVGDEEKARGFFRLIPGDCVLKVFAMDAFRQAGVKYETG